MEPLLREYLGVELVVGSELYSVKGICTGLAHGLLVADGMKKRDALKLALRHEQPHLGLAAASSHSGVLSLCKVCGSIPTRAILSWITMRHGIRAAMPASFRV